MAAKGKLLQPIHPGEILFEEFMNPLGISINRLARDIAVPPGRISAIVNGQRAISADTALRLGKCFAGGMGRSTGRLRLANRAADGRRGSREAGASAHRLTRRSRSVAGYRRAGKIGCRLRESIYRERFSARNS